MEHTLTTDTNDRGELDRLLTTLADALGRRLRRRNLATRRLRLLITYADWMEASRSLALPSLQLDTDLRAAARAAFALAVTRTVAIRTVGLVVDGLVEAGVQLELWDRGTGGQEDRQTVLDRITTRGGTALIQRGSVLALPHPLAPSPLRERGNNSDALPLSRKGEGVGG